MSLVPLNLFVAHQGRSSRQHVTCRNRCGDACSRPAPNTSDNAYFGDMPLQFVIRSEPALGRPFNYCVEERLGYLSYRYFSFSDLFSIKNYSYYYQ